MQGSHCDMHCADYDNLPFHEQYGKFYCLYSHITTSAIIERDLIWLTLCTP